MSFRSLPPAPVGGNLQGIGKMLLAGLFFSIMPPAVRHVANDGLHAFEIAFFRNLFGFLVIIPWMFRYGLGVLKTPRLDQHSIRAAVNTTSMLAGFYAQAIAPLAQVVALGFAAPIFATLLAIAFWGEKVGIRRWSAILFGFAGTLITVTSGLGGGISLGLWLAIFAAVGSGADIILIKGLGRTESAITITAYMSLLMAPMSLIPALFVWTWPTFTQIAWLVVIGVTGNIGQILYARSIHDGDTNVVMPFDYLRLMWIAAIAFAAFGEIPDQYTWIGGTMIFASAAYIAYRERTFHRKGGRKAPVAPDPVAPGDTPDKR
jgi:drug/metabolite transporter (DMT)-like permease